MRILILLLSALLAACGTPYATVPDSQGRPVMLLGFDPVAYRSVGSPTRGSPEHVVELPARSYYFATAQNKALFIADPQRYEPQYGGFCASGAAFAVKLGSDPTAWVIRDERLFICGDEESTPEAMPDASTVRPTARWSLGGAALRAGRSDISVPAAAADVDALAAAHREAIGRLSGQLPAAISPRH